MHTRVKGYQLYYLAERYGLSPEQVRALFREAQTRENSEELAQQAWQIIAIIGAGLCGFGLILWIAANWEYMGRATHFTLLQGGIVLMYFGAWSRQAARVPLGLLGLLGIGGLFAYYGQTYQTGADTWQLFALWAALALPLCLGLRSRMLWIAWLLPALCAISLWTYAQTGYKWIWLGEFSAAYVVHIRALFFCTLLLFALAPQFNKWTGSGPWTQSAALLLVCSLMLPLAIGAILSSNDLGPQYSTILVWMGMGLALFAIRPLYNLVNICLLMIGLDLLLLAGLYRALWLFWRDNFADEYLLLFGGLLATILCTISAFVVLLIARHHARRTPAIPLRKEAS